MSMATDMFNIAWSRNEELRNQYKTTIEQIRKAAEEGKFYLVLSSGWSYALLNKLAELGFRWEVCGRATIKWDKGEAK